LTLRPKSKLGFGPPIKDGFYYDFILSSPLNEEDFKALEQKMREILGQKQPFSYEDLPLSKAYEKLENMGEPYKKEYAQELAQKHQLKELRFFSNGPFVDMCEGPHVENTAQIPRDCFKIRSITGAYWRGDSNNTMMTRIYVWAFESKEELHRQIALYEEGLKRDHKKLGKELELFVVEEEIGKGLPLWLPNGTILRDEMEKYIRELEFMRGYQRVVTPVLTKSELYYQTGHLPYYKESMYPPLILKNKDGTEIEEYCLRPMNCPHHHKIFSSKPRSYRDLPLRLAEFGNVYRYEDSGALSGLLRVRGMCMNDGHIYCREDQIQDEFLSVMHLHEELYHKLGITNFYMRLSTWDPEDPKGKEKYVYAPEKWEKTQALIQQAMEASKLPYTIGKGEAAFYGPKIDFQFTTVTGREETASTNQLDFAIPERLKMTFIGADNQEYYPYVIHRAPMGTHERFVAFLIEHFGGDFPTWLAPVQVMFVPLHEKFLEYCHKLTLELKQEWVRVELDDSHDSFGKKIRKATLKKIPHILVVGEQEVTQNSVSHRRFGVDQQQTLPFEEFKNKLLKSIKERKLDCKQLLS